MFKDYLPQGYKFDLPTEAQWEYACRAGTTTSLNSGKNITSKRGFCPNLDEVGWSSENSKGVTHPVGQKKPNAWGIYDMHGNVLEWCNDWYGDYPKKQVTDPIGGKSGSKRILRSGSEISNFSPFSPDNNAVFRSANRYYNYPSHKSNDIGFRVALVPIE